MSDSFVTTWTVACHAPEFIGFPRKEYWSGLPFPPAWDIPSLRIKPMSPELAGRFLSTVPPEKSLTTYPLRILFLFVCELFILKFLSDSFLVSYSCRKTFKSFLQGHWAYGWLTAPDISRLHPGNIPVLSEFSQEERSACFSRVFHRDWGWTFQPGDVFCHLQ